MAEIKNRQDNPGPGIDYSEIYIPNDQDLGTGTYTAVIQPEVLGNTEPIMSWAYNPPVFQISVKIDPSKEEISVLLGKADGGPPESRRVFHFPEKTGHTVASTFKTDFANWQIEELTINGSICKSKYDLEL
ncbi:hypothetical protein ACFLWR_05395 [Chloroflexota bacterium]